MTKSVFTDTAMLRPIPLTMVGISASIHTHNADISTTQSAQANKSAKILILNTQLIPMPAKGNSAAIFPGLKGI